MPVFTMFLMGKSFKKDEKMHIKKALSFIVGLFLHHDFFDFMLAQE